MTGAIPGVYEVLIPFASGHDSDGTGPAYTSQPGRLNPFCFRSRFRRWKGGDYMAGAIVLIPFASGHDSDVTGSAACCSVPVLIPFASGHDSDSIVGANIVSPQSS